MQGVVVKLGQRSNYLNFERRRRQLYAVVGHQYHGRSGALNAELYKAPHRLTAVVVRL